MGSYIIKAAPDLDVYMEWSTVVEAPTFIGSRTAILTHLHHIASRGRREGDSPEDRVRRADDTGTSALPNPKLPSCAEPLEGAWDDAGFIVEQRGWLPRARLATFLALYLVSRHKAYQQLDPLDEPDA